MKDTKPIGPIACPSRYLLHILSKTTYWGDNVGQKSPADGTGSNTSPGVSPCTGGLIDW
jgi:hypothetical protein